VDLYIHSPIRLHGVLHNKLSARTTLPFMSSDKTRLNGENFNSNMKHEF
jgi:hypothetical protein